MLRSCEHMFDRSASPAAPGCRPTSPGSLASSTPGGSPRSATSGGWTKAGGAATAPAAAISTWCWRMGAMPPSFATAAVNGTASEFDGTTVNLTRSALAWDTPPRRLQGGRRSSSQLHPRTTGWRLRRCQRSSRRPLHTAMRFTCTLARRRSSAGADESSHATPPVVATTGDGTRRAAATACSASSGGRRSSTFAGAQAAPPRSRSSSISVHPPL
jgi:hypothetical protein